MSVLKKKKRRYLIWEITWDKKTAEPVLIRIQFTVLSQQRKIGFLLYKLFVIVVYKIRAEFFLPDWMYKWRESRWKWENCSTGKVFGRLAASAGCWWKDAQCFPTFIVFGPQSSFPFSTSTKSGLELEPVLNWFISKEFGFTQSF